MYLHKAQLTYLWMPDEMENEGKDKKKPQPQILKKLFYLLRVARNAKRSDKEIITVLHLYVYIQANLNLLNFKP